MNSLENLFQSCPVYRGTYWRHDRTQKVYRVEGLAYDSDREEMVVQYLAAEEPTRWVFSHLVSRFLKSFTQVEKVQAWQPVG